jgi:hypothetical protein
VQYGRVRGRWVCRVELGSLSVSLVPRRCWLYTGRLRRRCTRTPSAQLDGGDEDTARYSSCLRVLAFPCCPEQTGATGMLFCSVARWVVCCDTGWCREAQERIFGSACPFIPCARVCLAPPVSPAEGGHVQSSRGRTGPKSTEASASGSVALRRSLALNAFLLFTGAVAGEPPMCAAAAADVFF